MSVLNDAARRLIESGALAHIVTINDDGSPQISVVWVGWTATSSSPVTSTAGSAS